MVLKVFERRIGQKDRLSSRLSCEPVADKHVLDAQIPAVRIWNVGKRKRETRKFNGEGVSLGAVKATAKIRAAATRNRLFSRKELAAQSHRGYEECRRSTGRRKITPFILR